MSIVIWWFIKTVVINGIIGHALADWLIKYVIKPLLARSPRKSAIVSHRSQRILGEGHGPADPADCPETACRAVFA